MAKINPDVLRRLRKESHLSLAALAEKAGVDQQTIHRLEQGDRIRTHQTTIDKIANALRTDPHTLTGPTPEEDWAPTTLAWERKSQLNLRVTDKSRNALALVCDRFNVKPFQVVELAPFLFFWVAEQSLRRRKERLDELRQRFDEISELSDKFGTTTRVLVALNEYSNPVDQKDFISAEQESISKRDPFARSIDSLKNPISVFLGELASQLEGLAKFNDWGDPNSSPDYRICEEGAAALVNGDEEAVKRILSGHAPLHGLPKELRAPDRAEERTSWLRARGNEAWNEELGDIIRSSNELGQALRQSGMLPEATDHSDESEAADHSDGSKIIKFRRD
jgi:transcriptional regulator with XRE-family HTH domain